jgi:hypothetical protein
MRRCCAFWGGSAAAVGDRFGRIKARSGAAHGDRSFASKKGIRYPPFIPRHLAEKGLLHPYSMHIVDMDGLDLVDKMDGVFWCLLVLIGWFRQEIHFYSRIMRGLNPPGFNLRARQRLRLPPPRAPVRAATALTARSP